MLARNYPRRIQMAGLASRKRKMSGTGKQSASMLWVRFPPFDDFQLISFQKPFAGENFLVFRTETGEIAVFDAYCPHLGANLGVGGRVKGDCIECPFHHWQFRASDGQCVHVPYSKDGTIPKSSSLKKWTVCEVNDGIFVWYHADNEEPWKMPVVDEIASGEWIYQGRNEFLVNCHCQEIPENGADVAHLNAVHSPSMITGSDLRFARASWASFSSHAWTAK